MVKIIFEFLIAKIDWMTQCFNLVGGILRELAIGLQIIGKLRPERHCWPFFSGRPASSSSLGMFSDVETGDERTRIRKVGIMSRIIFIHLKIQMSP